jgi:DNA-binding transcriptional ArsR family regulator
VALLRELADPLRLRVVDRLGQEGPSTVSELAGVLEVPLPLLSNHLRRLREAGIVRVERRGRHAVYDLTDPGIRALLPVLDRITGRIAQPTAPFLDTDFARARTCYDHLAGRLGVELYKRLVLGRALVPLADGTVELGPHAEQELRALGVDAAVVDPGRRRFAYECFDSTEHAPHLAGALGDAVAAAAIARGWVERTPGARTLKVAPAGERALAGSPGR